MDTELKIKGGSKLARKLEEIAERLSGKDAELRVGFLEGATYPDGENRRGQSIPQVAFWQEFGTKSIPPRPFFRGAIAKHSPDWGNELAQSLRATGGDGKQALGIMGEVIKGQVVQSIVETHAPPLSPITLMLRKMRDDDPSLVITGATVAEAAARVEAGEEGATGTRAKPLIDTGVMQRAVDYRVTK